MRYRVYNLKANVSSDDGIHARAAADLVKELNKYTGEFRLSSEGNVIDMKSVLGLMSVVLKKGDPIDLKLKFPVKNDRDIILLLSKYFFIHTGELFEEETV